MKKILLLLLSPASLVLTPAAADVPLVTVSATTTSPADVSADPRYAKAQEKFDEGKRLFREGKRDEARRQFDAAVDLLLEMAENHPQRDRFERKLEEMIDRIYHFDLEAMGTPEQQQDPAFEKSPLDDIRELSFPVDPKLKSKVMEEIQATQSQLPLVVNDAVISFINYFNTERGRRTLLYGLKRAGRYKPMISRILAEEGVPQELIFLAQAESGFAPRAVSYMAAVGMWQFVQFRGREYGLMQSAWHDDRLDPEKATRAAARHLKDLYLQLGDWHLALAAYNCGPMCVEGAVQRTGYADYWELKARNALPRETSNYVPIILAMTIMAKNARNYGLEQLDVDDPVETDTVRIRTNTSLQLLADAAERPLAQIKELNPALLHAVVPADFEARVPRGLGQGVASALDLVPVDKRTFWRIHRAQSGDTLESVARQYRTTAAQVRAANPALAGTVAEPESGAWLAVPAVPEAPKPTYRYSSRTRARTGYYYSALRKPVTPAASRTSNAKTPAKAPAVRKSASSQPAAASTQSAAARRPSR